MIIDVLWQCCGSYLYFADLDPTIFLNTDPDPALQNRNVILNYIKKIPYEEFPVPIAAPTIGFLLSLLTVFNPGYFLLFLSPGSESAFRIRILTQEEIECGSGSTVLLCWNNVLLLYFVVFLLVNI